MKYDKPRSMEVIEFEIFAGPTKLSIAKAVLDREPFGIEVIHRDESGNFDGTRTVKVLPRELLANSSHVELWTLKGIYTRYGGLEDYCHSSDGRFEASLRTDKDEGWLRLTSRS